MIQHLRERERLEDKKRMTCKPRADPLDGKKRAALSTKKQMYIGALLR